MTTDPDWLDADAPATARTLGRWGLTLAGDELTDITYDSRPVLRSIRAVARDAEWSTVPVRVGSPVERANGFALTLSMTGFGAAIDAVLDVRADAGTLGVELSATMTSAFSSNRTGLVVLHDQSLAGTDLVVRDDRGGVARTTFPVHIAPHQPATDIRELSWSHDGLAVSLSFAGAVFEMEDQRNWGDASYKTYSGRLSDPHPLSYEPGDVVRQSVTLRVDPRPGPDRGRRAARPTRGHEGVFPEIQIGATTGPDPVPVPSPIPCSAVLVEIDAGSAGWRAALGRAAAEAGGRPLDVRIAAGPPGELAGVLEALGDVRRVAVFDRTTHVTTPELWAALSGVRAQLTAGTRGHFAQLNRTIGDLPAGAPALTFGLTPQVHARERRQLIDTIRAQETIVADALRLSRGRPLDIGPITLRPRITIDLPGEADPRDGVADGYGPQFVPGSTDPRQDAPALIAWTIASAAASARPGVRSLTWFELDGPRGVAGRPVARAVSALQALSGLPFAPAPTGLPDGVRALAAGHPGEIVTLVSNLSPVEAVVHLDTGTVRLPAWSAGRLTSGAFELLS